MKLKKNKKGVITMYLTFFIVAILIIVITAVFAPVGTLFNTKMYLAGQDILEQTNDSIQGITDANVRASVEGVVQSAIDSSENNIEVNANLFQYSWIFVIVIAAIVIFLYSRRLIEVGGTGGFV